MGFAHLHTHTEYSMLDGASRVSDLIARCKSYGMPALAMTDHGSMHGAIPFYEACVAADVKPIIGCELYVATGSRFRRDPNLDKNRYHITVLAENPTGYRNLLKLVTGAWLEGFYHKPRVDWELLATHSAGLVCLTGCLSSYLDRSILADDDAGGRRAIEQYLEVFGRGQVYVEVMNTGLPEQRRVNPIKVGIAKRLGLPVVATNDSHYTDRGDAKLHDLLVCIQTGKTLEDDDRLRFAEEYWFRSPEEMLAAVGEQEWLSRTLEVVERCNVEIPPCGVRMPEFPVPEGCESEEAYLRRLCYEMLPQRCDPSDPAVRERLEYELGIITQMGYAGYFLIVWDICRYARERGILIGFRGSAGASLVGYVLRIHDLDPMRMGLFFERFLNPERDDPPDADLDLPDDRRQEILDYVTGRYGSDRVAQVCTFGTMQARAAVRDAGRALGIPLATVDRVAKLVRSESIARALDTVPELAAMGSDDPSISELLAMAQRLEGLVRHASTHAAAVVISSRPLVESTPLFRVGDSECLTTQYGMEALKRVGIEKLDLLGLKTLTVLNSALSSIARRTGRALSLQDIPLDDRQTYHMLSQGDTCGVFQLESPGMRRLVTELQPESIADMMPLVALFRPGPLKTGMTDQFVRRRRGREPVSYRHPLLEPALSETFGVMVYQEQIMQISRDMGGFSLGQADILRAAMGKKKQSIMDAMRPRFIEGAAAKGVGRQTAAAIFDDMAKFAGYCFNKPHSAMYGIIAYYTAYLKANYPAEFMAAQLTSYMDDRDRVGVYIKEAERLGVQVRPPDVRESEADFAPDNEGNIRFGLAAIKGVGRGAVEAILQARAEGQFTGLFDFCRRVPSSAVNRQALEALIRAGAFDCFGSRAAHLHVLDAAVASAQQLARDQSAGQASLFGLDDGADSVLSSTQLPDVPELPLEVRLENERELLGFYVTANPLRELAERLRGRITHTALTLAQAEDGATVKLGGVLASVRGHTTKRGERMCFATLRDHEGEVDLVVFPKIYAKHADLLEPTREVLVQGKCELAGQGDPSAERGDVSGASGRDADLPPKLLVARVVPLPDKPGPANGSLPTSQNSTAPEYEPEPEPPPLDDNGAYPDDLVPTEDAEPAPPGELHIRVPRGCDPEPLLRSLREVLARHAGDSDVVLHLPDRDAERRVLLGPRYRVRPDTRLRAAVSNLGLIVADS